MITNNHPANGPVSLDRLHQIREILSKAAAQSDGGNLGYAMADAVKVIDEVLERRKAILAEWITYWPDSEDEIFREHSRSNEACARRIAEEIGGYVVPVYHGIAELQERRKADSADESKKPLCNPVLRYADSYRDMASRGVESIPIWSVITDLERNIAPLYAAPQPLTDAERAELQEHRKAQPVEVSFAMAYAFHHALTDSPLGSDEAEEIKTGLRAALANVTAPQPAPDSEAQATLKRLAVIMSGSDAPGEIRSLTVTAQSLVDRCKTLSRERDALQLSGNSEQLIKHQSSNHDSDSNVSGDEIKQPASNVIIGWLRSDYNSDDKRDPNAPLFMLGTNDPSETWGVKYIPLTGNSPVTPDGWKLVPVTAFPSQWAAGKKAFDSAGINKVDAVYKAMVAAAPQQE